MTNNPHNPQLLKHAQILSAYLFRLKLTDVDSLAQIVRDSWQLSHVVGGAAASARADRESQAKIIAMLSRVLSSDLDNIDKQIEDSQAAAISDELDREERTTCSPVDLF